MPKRETYFKSSTSDNIIKAKSADAAAKKAWRSAKKKGGVTIEQIGGGSDDDGPLDYKVMPGTNPFGTKKPHTMKGERKERGNKRFNGMMD
mmetsp:Transcript_106083/g.183038  ORF Transcript_106083/g.183038 Transcript_106083/m.183038 type:complete len:91 (-) Transcript_106083:682-954(-)